MRKLLLLLCFIAAQTAALSAQQVSEFIFGDSGWNNPQKIWQMPDGNLAMVTLRYNGNFDIAKLHHLSPEGQLLATYDLSDQNAGFNFVAPAADGATFRTGAFTNSGYTIRTINLQGMVIDSLNYLPQDNAFSFFAVKDAPNGDVVIAYGNQDSPAGVRVTRLSPQGAIVYSKYITTNYPDFYPNCLAVTPDGRVIVLVVDFTFGYRVICFGPSGTQMWTKSFPAVPSFTEYLGLVTMDNGNVALFGQNGSDNGVLIGGYAGMYPVSGPMVYNRRFSNEIPGFEPMAGFADGDQLILAGAYNEIGGFGLAVIKLDANGQTVFVRKFNRLSGNDNFKAGLTKNGDYVFSGFNWDQNGHGANAYVLCLQPDGTLNWKVDGGGATVRQINGFAHLSNGDLIFTGEAFQLQLPAGEIRNLLLRVSGAGGIYPHLLTGQIVVDSIDNCLADPGEKGRSAWILRAETPSTVRYATTDAEGRFSIRLEDPSAQLKVQAPNAIWAPCSAETTVDFQQSDTVAVSVPIKVTQLCPYLSIEASTSGVRRCFDNTYYLSWCNEGSQTAENTDLQVVMDSFFTFVQAGLPLSSSDGLTLHFSPGTLAPGQCGTMQLTVHSSCDASLGTLHCLSVALKADNGCPGIAGGTAAARECRNSVGAYDPNDKQVFVGDSLARGHTVPNTDMMYQIRFQNTGTDTAFNVVVVDTLSANLNINTLRLGAASHPCTMQVSGEGVIKFIFNNILLPDSAVNEPASHGFVNFRVAQQPNLPDFTQIDNTAGIYFDFNAPVRTNTARLTVGDLTATHDPQSTAMQAMVYPNPSANGQVWVDNLNPKEAIRHIRIFDAQGRQIQSVAAQGNNTRLLLPGAKGLYFIQVVLANGNSASWRIQR